jgi:hypothetical protein
MRTSLLAALIARKSRNLLVVVWLVQVGVAVGIVLLAAIFRKVTVVKWLIILNVVPRLAWNSGALFHPRLV